MCKGWRVWAWGCTLVQGIGAWVRGRVCKGLVRLCKWKRACARAGCMRTWGGACARAGFTCVWERACARARCVHTWESACARAECTCTWTCSCTGAGCAFAARTLLAEGLDVRGRAFAHGFVRDYTAPCACVGLGVHLHVGSGLHGDWVCSCKAVGSACTVLALAVCSHGNVLARGLGVHLHAGGGLHGAVHARAALRAMHKSTKLAQKLICTRAERGFAHRSVFARGCVLTVHGTSVFARGCVCLHGAVPPQGDHAPSHSSCVCPLHEALHKSCLSQAWHTPSPGTGHLHKVPCTRLPLHKRGSWAPAARCSREVRVCPCTGLAQSPLRKRVGGLAHGGGRASP